MSKNDAVYDDLMPTAEGDSGREAALRLLHDHGRWLPTLHDHGWITYGPDEEDAATGDYNEPYAYVQWDKVAKVLTDVLDGHTYYGSQDLGDAERALLVGSGSERLVLLIACSLADSRVRAPLNSIGSSLDTMNRTFVQRAIAHSIGGRTYADSLIRVTPRSQP